MKKKTIVVATAGTIAIVATGGILLKKFVFGNKKDDKKQIVRVDDIESIEKLVKELASRNDIDIDDEDVFIIVSGIINWGIKNGKKEFTPEQFGDAAIWAAAKAGLDIKF